MATARMKRDHEMPNVPADRTKILKGVGGGNNEGTIIARIPYFWYHCRIRSNRSLLNRFCRKASPPLRPTEYNRVHPIIEPSVVRKASFGMLAGLSIENVISRRSF